MRRVVSLWLPFWPTDRLRQSDAALPAEVPLVTRMHDGRRLVIAAVCPAARGLGLQPGMTVAQAQAMVPDLVVADAASEEDAQALRRLAAWCLRLSPMTAADPPDGVWIDATGCAHLHGGETAMLESLVRQLGRGGLQGRVAVADTPGAAHALARFGGKPVVVVEVGQATDALALLPVAALRIDARTAGGLRRLGLDLVGQLEATPRAPLVRRFGTGLLSRLDQAMGRVREPIRPVLPLEVIAVRHDFVEPLCTAEAFAAVVLLLVGEACSLLEQRGAGARRLDLVFERVDATVQVVRVGTAQPTRDVRHLARLLDERIGQVDPGLGVEAMLLVLPLVEPLGHGQQASGLVAAEADLSELVDRLLNRLGPGKVYRLQAVESDVPERSQRKISVFGPKGATSSTSPWPRPVRLLRRPEPVEALAMLPDHPPRAFTWRKVRHVITHADGPERIHGEWWRRSSEGTAVRDYWAVENQQGRRFWLYRQGDGVEAGTGALRWFLHGFF